MAQNISICSGNIFRKRFSSILDIFLTKTNVTGVILWNRWAFCIALFRNYFHAICLPRRGGRVKPFIGSFHISVAIFNILHWKNFLSIINTHKLF